MYRAKKKEIDGVEYWVLGTTIEYGAGLRIAYQSWTTTVGKVEFKNGQYLHPAQPQQDQPGGGSEHAP